MPNGPAHEWTSSGWALRPRSAREVMTLIASIGAYSANAQFAWRGTSSSSYRVYSSLHRRLGRVSEEEMRVEERRLLTETRAWGLGHGLYGHVDDLQLLTDLQHYGIPTRLIDVTSNPMTALWFACQTPKSAKSAKSGLLLALNISGWPTLQTLAPPNGREFVPTWDDLEGTSPDRLTRLLDQNERFVVRSLNPNDRLRAQEGFFVTGRLPGYGLQRRLSPFASLDVPSPEMDELSLSKRLSAERGRGAPRTIPFVALVIRADLKVPLLRYLEGTYNRSARVLFPDWAGLKEFGQNVGEREGVANK
jgi:hypothetical protein